MALETFPFDPAEHLDDAEAQAEFLTEALGAGDEATFLYALGVVARARGMSAVARDAGVQRENLYRALSKTGRPELTTVLKVVEALGLQLKVVPG